MVEYTHVRPQVWQNIHMCGCAGRHMVEYTLRECIHVYTYVFTYGGMSQVWQTQFDIWQTQFTYGGMSQVTQFTYGGMSQVTQFTYGGMSQVTQFTYGGMSLYSAKETYNFKETYGGLLSQATYRHM